MLDILKDEKKNYLLDKDILKKNITFFEWYQLSHEQKKRERLISENLIIEEVMKFTGSIDHHTYNYWSFKRMNRHFCNLLEELNLNEELNFESLATFKDNFSMFRCFSMKFLVYESVRAYMLNLINQLEESGKIIIIKKEFNKLLEEAILRNRSGFNDLIPQRHIFLIKYSTLQFFELSREQVIDFLSNMPYNFNIEHNKQDLYISFEGNSSKLPFLQILKLPILESYFNTFYNLGEFIYEDSL